jgi:hypothetical protein
MPVGPVAVFVCPLHAAETSLVMVVNAMIANAHAMLNFIVAPLNTI